MKKAIAVIFIVLTWVVLCASLEADDLLIRFDADGQKTAVKLFDYLDNGWTFWALGASGTQPTIYAGRWYARGKWFAEAAFGLPIDRNNGKLCVNDFLIDADLYYAKDRLSLVFVNELGGFYKTLWHFG